MSSLPPQLSNTSYAPRLVAKLEGYEIPAWDVEVGLSGYGTADTVKVTTFYHGLADVMGISILRESQRYAAQNKPMRLTVEIATDPNGLTTPLFRGFLDIINGEVHDDTLELTGRGILSLLLDQHITVKLKNNQLVESAIAEIVSRYGLNPIITG